MRGLGYVVWFAAMASVCTACEPPFEVDENSMTEIPSIPGVMLHVGNISGDQTLNLNNEQTGGTIDTIEVLEGGESLGSATDLHFLGRLDFRAARGKFRLRVEAFDLKIIGTDRVTLDVSPRD